MLHRPLCASTVRPARWTPGCRSGGARSSPPPSAVGQRRACRRPSPWSARPSGHGDAGNRLLHARRPNPWGCRRTAATRWASCAPASAARWAIRIRPSSPGPPAGTPTRRGSSSEGAGDCRRSRQWHGCQRRSRERRGIEPVEPILASTSGCLVPCNRSILRSHIVLIENFVLPRHSFTHSYTFLERVRMSTDGETRDHKRLSARRRECGSIASLQQQSVGRALGLEPTFCGARCRVNDRNSYCRSRDEVSPLTSSRSRKAHEGGIVGAELRHRSSETVPAKGQFVVVAGLKSATRLVHSRLR